MLVGDLVILLGVEKGRVNERKTKQRDESRNENKGGLDQGHVIEKVAKKQSLLKIFGQKGVYSILFWFRARR